MNLVNSMVINIYSIALLLSIRVQFLKQDQKESTQYKLYMSLLHAMILLLALDTLSRFDGNPGTIFSVINYLGNFMLFLLNPVVPSLWLLYVYNQVFKEKGEIRWLLYSLVVFNGINVTLVVLTQFFGLFYYIDSDNIYHRGPLFLLSASMMVILILLALALIVKSRKKIEKKHYFAYVFFAVPPCVGMMLQVKFYGTSIVLNGVVLSLFILYLNIQNHNLHIDYITGLNNRRKLDSYLREKINTSTPNKTFSAIMIDLDEFKFINDTFGHDTGDIALQIVAKLLKRSVKSRDFIARYGGDEFYIILGVSDKVQLEKIVGRINRVTDRYNEFSNRPYKLGLSIGYAVYDYNSHMKIEEFQKKLDLLMYENKKSNKKTK